MSQRTKERIWWTAISVAAIVLLLLAAQTEKAVGL